MTAHRAPRVTSRVVFDMDEFYQRTASLHTRVIASVLRAVWAGQFELSRLRAV